MKFFDAVINKKCLFATSDDHSEFCGEDRAEGSRNYCEEHQKVSFEKRRKKKQSGFSMNAWRPAKASEAAQRGRL